MSTAQLFWDGLVLGPTDDDTTRLRVLSTPGNPGVSGLGHPRPDADLVRRLVGGVHIGAVRPGEREIEVPLLQTRSWGVANRFVDSMSPGPDLRWLEIEGGPYPNRVALHVAPMGATPRWDVDSLGDREVVHVEGARWVAPDPTVYSAAETVVPVPHGSQSQPWTNAGAGVPPHGLGGHAWTLVVELASGSNDYVRITSEVDRGAGWVQDAQVFLRATGPSFEAGDRVIVGADRVPVHETGGDRLPVRVTDSAGVPTAAWPRFEAGVPTRLVMSGPGTALVTTAVMRHTWS